VTSRVQRELQNQHTTVMMSALEQQHSAAGPLRASNGG
jgi:hypothetical protein